MIQVNFTNVHKVFQTNHKHLKTKKLDVRVTIITQAIKAKNNTGKIIQNNRKSRFGKRVNVKGSALIYLK
jgi:hypothetical protein